jgi:hypothetical protein
MLRRLGVVVALTTALLATSAGTALAGTPPKVWFDGVRDLRQTSATFHARADNGDEGFFEYEFSYCPTAQCPNGTVKTERVTQSQGVGNNEVVAFSQRVTGLRPDTEYSAVLTVGNDTYWVDSPPDRPDNQPTRVRFTFRTPADTVIFPIQAATDPASGISNTAATLNGAVVPGNAPPTAAGAEVAFEWGEGSALDRRTESQIVPSGSSAVPVAASLTGLQPGKRYSYRLVATRNGARAEGAVRTFDTAQIACAAGSSLQTVTIGRTTAVGCLRAAGRRWVAEGEVLLNGLKLTPAAAGTTGYRFANCTDAACQALQTFLSQSGPRLYIDEAGKAIGTSGAWNISAGRLGLLHRGTLALRNVDFSGAAPLMALGADRSVNLFSMPLAGEFTFTPQPGGAGQIGVLVGLPKIFGGITGESKVGLTPGGDVQLDGLRIEVGEVNLGSAALEGLSFTYDRASDLWRGAGTFVLPMENKLKVGVSVTVKEGRFNEFTGQVDNLNRHIADGIFLQRIGVLVGIDPLRIGGTVGISAGPKILGVRALGVDGSFLYSSARSERRHNPAGNFYYYVSLPPSLTVGGTVSFVEIPLRSAEATYYFAHYAWFDLKGSMGYEIKSGSTVIAGLTGGVEASVFRTDLSLGGWVKATILNYDVASAYALANNKGVSACGAVWDFAIGAYQRWGGANGVFWACSMEQLRARISSASAAQAGAGSVTLKGGKQGMIRLVGAGAPPEVELRGPGGRTVVMPPAGQNIGGRKGQYLVIRDPSTNATSVMLARPGKGPWRYTVQPGSTRVRSVQTAGLLPRPQVRASVVRTRRDRARGTRTLRWRLKRIPGQKVTFTEEGAGVPPRKLAVTTRARGTKRFTPARVPATRHTIVATVEQDGRPRSRKVVARFTAPRPAKAARVRALKAIRKGTRVEVRWRGQAGALRYDVVVAHADGRRALRRVTRPRLSLRGAAGVRRLSVRAVGADGKPGPAVSAPVRRR